MSELLATIVEALARSTGNAFSGLSHALRNVTEDGAAIMQKAGGAVADTERSNAAGIADSAEAGLTRAPVRYRGSHRAPVPSFVVTGLGRSVDTLIAHSPTALRDTKRLLDGGWEFKLGEPGGGSRTVLSGTVVIDSGCSDLQAASALSHELGHAIDPPVYVSPVGLTRSEYADVNTNIALRSEGTAVVKNFDVRAEIHAATGRDIGVSAGRLAAPYYESVYTRYANAEITRGQAVSEIAHYIRYDVLSTALYHTYAEDLRGSFAQKYDDDLSGPMHDVPHT